MNHFIEKNILIDDLLELEIMYMPEVLEIFNELKSTDNIDNDIELLDIVIQIIDSNIWETEEYLKSVSISLDNLEFVSHYKNSTKDQVEPVILYYSDGKIIKEFNSQKECAEFLLVSPASVCNAIKYNRLIFKNYN